MKWEDLKVYRPLTKEELKPTFKDFIKIIADNLGHFGFELRDGRFRELSMMFYRRFTLTLEVPGLE